MNHTLESYIRALRGIGPIIFRHVFLFVNAIIFAVVALLFVFGDAQAGLFLGIIIVINIALGVIQDFRARVALEKLQLITALRVIRLNKDGVEELVLTESIGSNERIQLKLGDQVPCDGKLLSVRGFEVSEALITGESASFPKKVGDKILGGDIVTSGTGVMLTETTFSESRMAKMAQDIKKYSANPSTIQKAIEVVIVYTGYLLVPIIVFIVARGIIIHEPAIRVVNNVGALASTIIPQGLVVVTTLLFAFGAASYSRKHVLFQEINATEKLGRIKNLCMDKTGTLTENKLVVKKMLIPEHVPKHEEAELTTSYVCESGDTSQTMGAIKSFLGDKHQGRMIDVLPFSSWRHYGGVRMHETSGDTTALMGSPDIFLPHLSNARDRVWLTSVVQKHAREGNRIMCIVRSKDAILPRKLVGTPLSVIAVFELSENLREGINDTIAFFQNRGIRIRILSGDSADTVHTVAVSAGIAHADAVITGPEMESWSQFDFDKNVGSYTIFARIVPEQKANIIDAFKKDGFTAMVGDGANDALAIKKADLGISMFDGAPATRQLAAVVLMKNMFTELPGGMRLADNFIKNIEIFGGIFLNQSLIGLFLFFILSIFGSSYPLTPLNVTLINYFTVGLPGLLISYWAIRPPGEIAPPSTEPFLKRVLPYPVLMAFIEAIGIAVIVALSPAYLRAQDSNILVMLAFVGLGFIFFMLAPKVYGGMITRAQKIHLLILGVFELALLFFVLNTPLLVNFFNIIRPYPQVSYFLVTTLIICIFGYMEYTSEKRLLSSFTNRFIKKIPI